MKNFNKKTSSVLIGSAIAMAAGSVQAQQSGGYTLEEVSITARKVEENMQDVPVAVTALTGEGLERRQITGTDDIAKVTPNLEFSSNAPLTGNNSSSMVFIRGIGQVDGRANVDPGVGLYIDDVYMGQSVGGTMELRDIAGVQVLRGPQGTLFGRNTIGGAVLLTTNAPGDEFGGNVRVGVGSDNLREVFAAVDLPLSDQVKSRFTLGSKQQDGYVTRLYEGTDLGDTDNYTATAKLEYTPTDDLLIKFAGDYTEADENGSPMVFAAASDTSAFGARQSMLAGCPGASFPPPVIPQGIDDARCFNEYQNAGPYANNGTNPLESSLENWGLSLQAIYDISSELVFKSITSYRELSWVGIRDADNTPLTILHTDYRSSGDQLSQELQLTYQSDRLTGVGGLYYFDEEVEDILTVTLGIRDTDDSDNNTTVNSSWAAFTQWSYDFTDRLSGTLGLRYTEDTKGSIPDQFDYVDPDTKYLEVKLYEETFDATTLAASLSYQLSDTVMAYGSYSEGFKGGGWNSSFNQAQSDEALESFHMFLPEEAETWELGLKADFTDSLRLNGAVFTTDYTNLQFIYRVGTAPYLLNAGKASIDGAELELTWIPGESWIVEAGIGYLDDSIDAINTDWALLGASTPITTDNTLPFTPEYQGNLGIGYTFTAGSLAVSPRVDIAYRDETYFDTANTPEIAQLDPITTVDASVSIEPDAGSWRLVAGVNNATDETYPISGNSSLTTGSGYAEIAYTRPRVYFVNLNYDF